MRLYGISIADVETVVASAARRDQEGRHLIAHRQFFRRFGNLPVKVVYVLEEETVIISVYPLKRSYRR